MARRDNTFGGVFMRYSDPRTCETRYFIRSVRRICTSIGDHTFYDGLQTTGLEVFWTNKHPCFPSNAPGPSSRPSLR